MTKKDHIKIAEVLKTNRNLVSNNDLAGDEKAHFAGFRQACDMIIESTADMLENDNPLFDRNRFLNACGYND